MYIKEYYEAHFVKLQVDNRIAVLILIFINLEFQKNTKKSLLQINQKTDLK